MFMFFRSVKSQKQYGYFISTNKSWFTLSTSSTSNKGGFNYNSSTCIM